MSLYYYSAPVSDSEFPTHYYDILIKAWLITECIHQKNDGHWIMDRKKITGKKLRKKKELTTKNWVRGTACSFVCAHSQLNKASNERYCVSCHNNDIKNGVPRWIFSISCSERRIAFDFGNVRFIFFFVLFLFPFLSSCHTNNAPRTLSWAMVRS